MKWRRKVSRLFAREPAVTEIPDCRTSRPLLDVWSRAVCGGQILVDKEAVKKYLRSIEPASAIDQEWKHSTSNPYPYISSLGNVTVITGTRILIDDGGNARSDEISASFRRLLLRPKRWDMEILEGPRLGFTPPSLSDEVIPAGIHLMGEHEANYFHWFAEILPRIYLYMQLTGEKALPLLVSDGLNENLYDLLRIVCGNERVVKRLDPNLGYRVATLVYPSDVNRILDVYDRPPSHETTYLSVGLLKKLVREIKSTILPDTSAGLGRRRLFVRRASTYRTLLNEAEVEKLLVDSGFISIDPAQLSIREQVELFANAEIVIGPSGAAMTNMVWCCDHASILVLHSDHPFKKYPYWDALARVSGTRISYLSGPRANNISGLFEAHDDYSISIDALGNAMKELGCV